MNFPERLVKAENLPSSSALTLETRFPRLCRAPCLSSARNWAFA